MASGDPPVTGNPVNQFGTISFEAVRGADPDNVLRVKLVKNKRLVITIHKGDGSDPVIVEAQAKNWSLLLDEID